MVRGYSCIADGVYEAVSSSYSQLELGLGKSKRLGSFFGLGGVFQQLAQQKVAALHLVARHE